MRFRDRRGNHSTTASSFFPAWQSEQERWLLVSPHDDDVVLGAGLLLLQSAREGISTTVCVVTDGRMGYCRTDQRDDIADIRRAETEAALAILGTPDAHRLEYPDCDLDRYAGRRRLSRVGADAAEVGAARAGAVGAGASGADAAGAGTAQAGVARESGSLEEPDPRAGHTGLQNSFTACLRDLQPTRVFVPTGADYHPDHKVVHRELLISLFHASGPVWPELGRALSQMPHVYEMAIYCDFPTPPTLQLAGDGEDLKKKLAAIEAFESQGQIGGLVRSVRDAGPFEYFRSAPFSLYDSKRYADYFPTTSAPHSSDRNARTGNARDTETGNTEE